MEISPTNQSKKMISKEEEEDMLSVMQLPISLALNMVLKVTMELGIFDLLSLNSQLSSSQIASKIPTKNPQAPIMIEKILSFLANQSLLKFTLFKEDDENGPFYSLTPLSRNLVSNNDEMSIAPTFLFINDQAMVNSWYKPSFFYIGSVSIYIFVFKFFKISYEFFLIVIFHVF